MFILPGEYSLRVTFMIERLTHVTVLVRDSDEALEFYTNKLGFEKVEDSRMPSGDRWLTVRPKGGDVQVVLQRPGAATFGEEGAEEMLRRVGQGTAWAFKVDDCQRTCDELAKKGVKILSPLRTSDSPSRPSSPTSTGTPTSSCSRRQAPSENNLYDERID